MQYVLYILFTVLSVYPFIFVEQVAKTNSAILALLETSKFIVGGTL